MTTKIKGTISKVSGKNVTVVVKVQFQKDKTVTLPVKPNFEDLIDKALSLLAVVVTVEVKNGKIISIEKVF